MVCTIFLYLECVKSADSIAKLSSSMKSQRCLKRYFGPTLAKSLRERLHFLISATGTGGTSAGAGPSSVTVCLGLDGQSPFEIDPW